ncbi:hypothetical protein J2X64_000342 [Phycicoccus sp. 3266]|nr:hypothetical protein [Phycicoccus sp. 3266]
MSERAARPWRSGRLGVLSRVARAAQHRQQGMHPASSDRGRVSRRQVLRLVGRALVPRTHPAVRPHPRRDRSRAPATLLRIPSCQRRRRRRPTLMLRAEGTADDPHLAGLPAALLRRPRHTAPRGIADSETLRRTRSPQNPQTPAVRRRMGGRGSRGHPGRGRRGVLEVFVRVPSAGRWFATAPVVPRGSVHPPGGPCSPVSVRSVLRAEGAGPMVGHVAPSAHSVPVFDSRFVKSRESVRCVSPSGVRCGWARPVGAGRSARWAEG